MYLRGEILPGGNQAGGFLVKNPEHGIVTLKAPGQYREIVQLYIPLSGGSGCPPRRNRHNIKSKYPGDYLYTPVLDRLLTDQTASSSFRPR